MISIEDIKKRISKLDNWKTTNDYVGFDMNVVDTVGCIADGCAINYKLLTDLFPDYFTLEGLIESNCNEEIYLCAWKGVMWLGNKDMTNIIQEFGGWSTEDIIYWLIENEWFKKKIKYHEVYRVITPSKRYNVCKRQNWRCNICGTHLKYSKKHSIGEEVAHIDHIHPFSKHHTYINGSDNINELSNLQALCPSCNLKKSKKEMH